MLRILPILGILFACLLMAVGNMMDNNAIFIFSNVMLIVCGFLFFRR